MTDCAFIGNSTDGVGAVEQGGGGVFADTPPTLLQGNLFSANAAPQEFGDGGGVYVAGMPAFSVVTGNAFTGNSSTRSGGGAYLYGATASWNSFEGNRSGQGGGASVDASGSFDHNSVTGNHAMGGAGISNLLGSPVASNNLISNNGAVGGGGALISGSLVLLNNTLCGNTSESTYGAIYCPQAATPILRNNVIAFNDSGIEASYASVVFRSNDIYGNKSYNFQEATNPTGANGNISADPKFVNRTGGDFHMLAGSPCIDAGDNTGIMATDTDLDQKPRISGTHVDMGAYEFTSGGPFGRAEVLTALKLIGGLQAAQPSDVLRLNTVGTGDSALRVDLLDGVRLARKAAGLDANP